MSSRQLLSNKDRLGGYLQRFGLEGESAFSAIAHHYVILHSIKGKSLPVSIKAKWEVQYNKIKSVPYLVEFLNELVRTDPLGSLLPEWYQFFVGRRFREGSGKFFTPKPIAHAMAELLPKTKKPVIMDPTAGAGTFLMEASKIWADVECTLVANDVEPSLVELAMLTLGLGASPRHSQYYLSENIFDELDGLKAWYGKVDYILANPPFSLRIDNEQFESVLFAQGYKTSDALFIDTALKLLRPGGRLVCLLPHSIVANNEFSALRRLVEKYWSVFAVVSLPEGVFQLSGGTSTRADIVVLDKKPISMDKLKGVVFASVPSVGIRLNNNAKDVIDNDLEKLLGNSDVKNALGLDYA